MIEPFTKSSTHPVGRLRLRKELMRLRQAQHPAVVQVSGFEDGDECTRLELVRGGATTIAESPPQLPELALAFIAAVAGVVGDLHAIGLAHRRLTGDHIIVTPDGYPLLCGFADATMPASAEEQEIDQRSLGALVDLLDQSASSVGRHARAAKALRILAVEVAQSDGEMTASILGARAAKLAARYPVAATASKTGDITSAVKRLTSGLGRASAGSRLPKPIGALCALVVMMAGIIAFAGVPGSDGLDTNAGDAEHSGDALSMGAVVGDADHSGDDARSATTGSPATVSPSPTVLRPIDAEAGTPAVWFEAGGATFAVGEAGDEVFVGDWKCTGEPAALLWRPGTGDLYVFATLPGPGVDATGTWAASSPGGVLVLPDRDAACPPLAIRDSSGSTIAVELP